MISYNTLVLVSPPSLPTIQTTKSSQKTRPRSWSGNYQNTANQITRGTITCKHNPQVSLTPNTASDMCVPRTEHKKHSTDELPCARLSPLPALSVPTFNVVYTVLYSVRAKWYELGLLLGFSAESLDSIRIDEFYQTEGCLRTMLHKRMETKQFTWEEIVVALRSPTVNRNDLAERIEKGDLNYSKKFGVDYDLREEPMLEELCALPVKKVWYQLGVWLGVEDIILSRKKYDWPSDKLKWIFTAFLNLPIGTKEYKKLIQTSSEDVRERAKELIKHSKLKAFIGLFPSSKQTAAKELAKRRKDPKYPTLITALVKVGKRKIAEEVCSRKGIILLCNQ